MKSSLIIVESPAKAKTIQKYLGNKYAVKASVGHIKDLPRKTLGVDVKGNFKPKYEVIPGKKKIIEEIKKAAKGAKEVFLAPDPDREGEAIAWHVAEEVKSLKKPPIVHRVLFNEITKKSINEAMSRPINLDQNMFEAQQARRILDRLVGYQISPLLWDKVRGGLSAGRVQSVAVRLVCEREEEIKKFKSEEYWHLEVKLEGNKSPVFIAKLHKKDGKKIELKDESESKSLAKELKGVPFVLDKIERKEQKRHPSPPFITSKLQQEAARKLGFSAKKTMLMAQKLYEGVEVEGDLVGLITYMRTDSTRVAGSAIDDVRSYIKKIYGADFVPQKPNFYKSKKGAQDAHEAIRPTFMEYTPDVVKKHLKRDEIRLYDLIWKRFVASQMVPALLDRTVFVILAKSYEFRASGSVIRFPGFISVYTEGTDEKIDKDKTEDEEGEGKHLPDLGEGEKLKCHEFLPSQHFTQPPPRYTEASLVKDLEEKGIGRPSTYASILSVIQDKKYVEKLERRNFRPTDLGSLVNGLLVKNFPNVLDVKFTARMEEELDEVEEGKMNWIKALEEFYTPFSQVLKEAKVKMKDVKRQEIPTDISCDKCGSPMIIKFGRHGEFLACKTYPYCKNTKEFRRDEGGEIRVKETKETGEVCEKCNSPMIIKRGRFGKFLACQAYPKCKNTKALSIGVSCPKCESPLTERRSKRGRVFYGCSAFPKCKFASWQKPIAEKCPDCGSPYLIEQYSKAKGLVEIRCPEKKCKYRRQNAPSEN